MHNRDRWGSPLRSGCYGTLTALMMLVWPDPGIQPVTTITMWPDLKNPLAFPEGWRRETVVVRESDAVTQIIRLMEAHANRQTDLSPCQSWPCCRHRRPRREQAAGGRGQETHLLRAGTDGPPEEDQEEDLWVKVSSADSFSDRAFRHVKVFEHLCSCVQQKNFVLKVFR